MKKLGLAIGLLIAFVGIYYVTVGSKQVTREIKKEVNREITKLQSAGFTIEKQELQDNKEHLVLDFNNTEEIAKYLQTIDKDISKEDVAFLKGLKLGLDIEYNPNLENAVACDIYPVRLPDIMYVDLEGKGNDVIKSIEDMMNKKEILAHININKFLSKFDGYVKDIDKQLKLKGVKFDGEIDGSKIKNLNNSLVELSFAVPNELKMELINLKLFMTNPIAKGYDNHTEYSIDLLNVEGNETIRIEGIKGSSDDIQKGKLLNSLGKLNITSINYKDKSENLLFKGIYGEMDIKNIDMETFLKLNSLLSQDKEGDDLFKEMIPLLKRIIASDIFIDVPSISIAKIVQNGKAIDGFNLKALLKLNKNFNLKSLESEPLAITKLLNANVELEASNELVALISSNPKAMVIMMILQPIDKNGKKYYNIEFTNGTLKINGKALI